MIQSVNARVCSLHGSRRAIDHVFEYFIEHWSQVLRKVVGKLLKREIVLGNKHHRMRTPRYKAEKVHRADRIQCRIQLRQRLSQRSAQHCKVVRRLNRQNERQGGVSPQVDSSATFRGQFSDCLDSQGQYAL